MKMHFGHEDSKSRLSPSQPLGHGLFTHSAGFGRVSQTEITERKRRENAHVAPGFGPA